MAPYTFAIEECKSLILNGIKDDKRANPLAAQCCRTVIELVEGTAMLEDRLKNQAQQSRSSGKADTARQTSESASSSLFKRPPSRQCFNCSESGHLSRDCTKPKTSATLRAEEKRNTGSTPNVQSSVTNRQANCFLRSTGGSLPIVDGFVHNGRPVKVCIDSNASHRHEDEPMERTRAHPSPRSQA